MFIDNAMNSIARGRTQHHLHSIAEPLAVASGCQSQLRMEEINSSTGSALSDMHSKVDRGIRWLPPAVLQLNRLASS